MISISELEKIYTLQQNLQWSIYKFNNLKFELKTTDSLFCGKYLRFYSGINKG